MKRRTVNFIILAVNSLVKALIRFCEGDKKNHKLLSFLTDAPLMHLVYAPSFCITTMKSFQFLLGIAVAAREIKLKEMDVHFSFLGGGGEG